MEEIKLDNLAVTESCLCLNQNLPDEARNRVDGCWDGEYPDGLVTCIRKSSLNSLTDRPDSLVAGKRIQHFDGIICDQIIELTDQSLVRTKNDRRDRL